jgi:NitT/TauT family transport system ATP-binding protein
MSERSELSGRPMDESGPLGGQIVNDAPVSEPATAVGAEALTFDHISKTFPDGPEALTDVSFSVRPGEFATVVGPSGCGKSTLLRIASGLTPATGGSARVVANNLGYVFQDATLLPWRTVQKNVELLAELHKVPKAERKQLADEAIALVGLQGFERHHPRRLSGGMRMRVSLARSLTLNPEVFLFDEPFGALDEITRERLNDELIRLFLSQRFAALFITHSVYEAVFLSTRVLVMSARPGRIVGDFPIPVPYPRSQELRFEPEFAALTGAVSLALRGGYAGRLEDDAPPEA